MCGICGFIQKSNLDISYLEKMNSTLKHRGPDDDGAILEYDNNRQIGFGHTRLSILDLSSLGHQPMFSFDRKIFTVYNGEIYNYKEIRKDLIELGYEFRSNTDTEVVVNAFYKWGIDSIKKFNGMFSIAIYDTRSSTLYLIRDRMGIKPLYYFFDGEHFAFASELKAIMKYPFFSKDIDYNALGDYLTFRYVPSPKAIFRNVYKLPPGSYLTYSNGEIEVRKYWSIEQYRNSRKSIESEKEYLDKLDVLLTDSVKQRLVSDVPIGAFLSGGVDSSLVVAIMQKVSSSPVKTFTIEFNEEEYNEAKFASQIANYLKTDHHQLTIGAHRLEELMEKIPEYYDEPFADDSQLPTLLLSSLTRKYVTVALSGDGGDELFCGYNKYPQTDNYYRKYSTVSTILNKIDKNNSIREIFFRLNRKLLKLTYLNNIDNSINFRYFDSLYVLKNILLKSEVELNKKYFDLIAYDDELINKYMFLDINTFLVDDILTKVDRASMSVSLEVRVPILDHRVVEYALETPLHLKYKNHQNKYILKQLLNRYYPKEYFERPKHGFSVPLHSWLKTALRQMVNYYLSPKYIKEQGIFNYQVIKNIRENSCKDNYYNPFLWTILNFQFWYEKYMK